MGFRIDGDTAYIECEQCDHLIIAAKAEFGDRQMVYCANCGSGYILDAWNGDNVSVHRFVGIYEWNGIEYGTQPAEKGD